MTESNDETLTNSEDRKPVGLEGYLATTGFDAGTTVEVGFLTENPAVTPGFLLTGNTQQPLMYPLPQMVKLKGVAVKVDADTPAQKINVQVIFGSENSTTPTIPDGGTANVRVVLSNYQITSLVETIL